MGRIRDIFGSIEGRNFRRGKRHKDERNLLEKMNSVIRANRREKKDKSDTQHSSAIIGNFLQCYDNGRHFYTIGNVARQKRQVRKARNRRLRYG